MKKILLLSFISLFGYTEPRLYFIEPANDTVHKESVHIKFGLQDFGVAPAGLDYPNSAHHHLIINAPLPDLSLPIPADFNYRHFGAGQTEAVVKLEPGTYKLQLLLGNYLHIPHQEALYSDVITITVE